MASLNRYQIPDRQQAFELALREDTATLMAQARQLRDDGFNNIITYSRKVFIPLTQLCRDVCHYCTFAQVPRKVTSAYMSLDEVLETVHQAQKLGCKEALFTLGERPEDRYRSAREALDALGFSSTIDYLTHIAGAVFEQTGVLPHINAGCMTPKEIAALRTVSASMGIMLESSSTRLCEKGMPHWGSPDKHPERRLETIRQAGEASVPFTSGILIGIGETRVERVESLLELRELHLEYGHIQEIIVQNFRAKPDTRMANAAEPDLNELLWTIAITRLIFGPQMSIQAPPNLSPGVLPQLINAGLNDWGGVSPITPDYVNPEAPWPHLNKLARETAIAGRHLQERLTIYPNFALNGERWLATRLQTSVLQAIDAEGYPRTDDWVAGQSLPIPNYEKQQLDEHLKGRINGHTSTEQVSPELRVIITEAVSGKTLSVDQIVRLFQARGPEMTYLCQQADKLRKDQCGNAVTYVVNRNINYTNICYFKCQFCAFSKGKLSENLRGRPYDLEPEEITRRVIEAWEQGATEVCLQGGIHPKYTGQTYLDILRTIKSAAPEMHVHAFSALEVWQGATTLGITVKEFLVRLKEAGLGSMPGTAAEILDDDVRAQICPDKINTEEWLEVIETAHKIGIPTTSTIMFGHVDSPRHWAKHLLQLRNLQQRSGGITEFVPLPFVHMEAPIYLKGRSRKGPTFREVLLMHSVARLVLNQQINNIQTSWVKLGEQGALATLVSGVNDLGGTLMNESISRAAGAVHGQEMTSEHIERIIVKAKRQPQQRTTLYTEPSNGPSKEFSHRHSNPRLAAKD